MKIRLHVHVYMSTPLMFDIHKPRGAAIELSFFFYANFSVLKYAAT